MKHPGIINEISNTQWAMRSDAFDAMLCIIEGEGDVEREIFHSLDESSRIAAFSGNLGDRVEGTELTRVRENIGFLDIDGPIVSRSSGVAKVSGLTSIQGLTNEFQALVENEDIEQIVLLLDTPGGVVKGTSEFAEMIAKCPKSVTAYVWGTAASAGYWIASQADRIVSSDTGIVGSIGVVLTYSVNKSTGIGKIVSSQSPNKQMELSSAKGKKSAQRMVDQLADIFIGAVAEGRDVSAETVKKNYGKGDVFVAAEAKDKGMIDSVMSLSQLVGELDGGEEISVESHGQTGGITAHSVYCENPWIKGTYADLTGTYADEFNIYKPTISKMETDENNNNAGSSTNSAQMEVSQMTLKELMATDPNVREDIEAIKKEAYEAGASGVQSRVDKVVSYFENENYPKAISNLAIKVLKGDEEAAAITGAVTLFDAQAEHDKLRNAQADSESVAPTPSQQLPAISSDGTVKTIADEEAMLARLRGTN